MEPERDPARERAARAEELIERMRRQRGYLYPEWEFAARMDPDFMAAYDGLYPHAFGEGEVLSAKLRELIAIGVLTTKGDADALRQHIRRARRLGASTRELFETLQSVLVPAGAIAFLQGLRVLREVTQEEEVGRTAGADAGPHR